MSLQRGVLGNAIRTARIRAGYTHEELAELLDITPTHLKHIESEHRRPSVEVLLNMMELLHLSLDSLVFPQSQEQIALIQETYHLLAGCTETELHIVNDLVRSLIKNRTE